MMHLIERSGFELVEHDVIFPYVRDVDEVYNLACPASLSIRSGENSYDFRTGGY